MEEVPPVQDQARAATDGTVTLGGWQRLVGRCGGLVPWARFASPRFKGMVAAADVDSVYDATASLPSPM